MNKTAKTKWENENCFKYAKNHTISSYSFSIDDYNILYSIIKKRFINNKSSNLSNWLHSERIYESIGTNSLNSTDDSSEFKLMTMNISYEIDSAKEQTSCKLKPFKAIHIDNSNEDFDAYINAGGPIWATAFSSSNKDDLNNNVHQNYLTIQRKLVVGISRVGYNMKYNEKQQYNCGIGSDSIHLLGKPEYYNNILQIWNIKAMNLPIKSPIIIDYKKNNNNNNNIKNNIIKIKKKLGRPRKVDVLPNDKVNRLRGRPLKYPKEVKQEAQLTKKIKLKQSNKKIISNKLSKKVIKTKLNNKKDKKPMKMIKHDSDIDSDNECITTMEEIKNVDIEDNNNDNLNCNDMLMENDDNIDTVNIDNYIDDEGMEISLGYCISLHKRGPTWGCSWAPIKDLEAFQIDRND